MTRGVNRWDIEWLLKEGNNCQALINGRWVPARPLGWNSYLMRLRLAWDVFTGRADALYWPEGQ